MTQISRTQEEFFLALKGIQETVVASVTSKLDISVIDVESIVYDITSETICQIMTLLDGYLNESVQLDIIDLKSGEPLRAGLELHDKCVDYLKFN